MSQVRPTSGHGLTAAFQYAFILPKDLVVSELWHLWTALSVMKASMDRPTEARKSGLPDTLYDKKQFKEMLVFWNNVDSIYIAVVHLIGYKVFHVHNSSDISFASSPLHPTSLRRLLLFSASIRATAQNTVHKKPNSKLKSQTFVPFAYHFHVPIKVININLFFLHHYVHTSLNLISFLHTSDLQKCLSTLPLSLMFHFLALR